MDKSMASLILSSARSDKSVTSRVIPLLISLYKPLGQMMRKIKFTYSGEVRIAT